MGHRWHLVGGGRDAAQCPTVHRTAPTTKKYLTPNDSSAEKPQAKPFLLERKTQNESRVGEGKRWARKKREFVQGSLLSPWEADDTVGPPQVDDILEDWVWEMVAALKSQLAQSVNVGLAEWVTLAHNHYTTAVRNTRLVGQEIAALLQWLQVRPALTSLLSSPFPSLPPRLSELGWSPTAAETGQPLLLSSQE